MTTLYEPVPLTVPAAWADEVFGDDDCVIHVECCRRDQALCGQDLTGYTDGDAPHDHDCGRCEFCDRISELGLSCGAAFCRVRRTWRAWRSR